MKGPHVICHMMCSIDGRIISKNWGTKQAIKSFSAIYETCHESFNSQAWMCGRVTLEKDFTKGMKPKSIKPARPIAREPFIGDKNAESFAIAVDAKGKLGWQTNELNGDHIIQILTEKVSDAYLHYLQQKKVSYFFAGKKEINFSSALRQLAELFPIQTIMLEGGGNINGSMLNKGLINELSLLIIPVVDGTPGTPATFDVSEYLEKNYATSMKLMEVKQLEHDVVWLKYRMNKK